jgi:hypothetical protein
MIGTKLGTNQSGIALYVRVVALITHLSPRPGGYAGPAEGRTGRPQSDASRYGDPPAAVSPPVKCAPEGLALSRRLDVRFGSGRADIVALSRRMERSNIIENKSSIEDFRSDGDVGSIICLHAVLISSSRQGPTSRRRNLSGRGGPDRRRSLMWRDESARRALALVRVERT